VSFGGTLCLVLLATYGLANVLLSIGVAALWRARVARPRPTSGGLFALRLLPSVGASFVTLTVVLPAFLIHEPSGAAEPLGPLLLIMAGFALVLIGAGALRGRRAWAAAAALLRDCRPSDRRCVILGFNVDIVDVREPMVAVVGAWRPRIVAAARVVAACNREEFREVIGHEAAHITAHDNLKLLLLLASPDVLAWMPAGDALIAGWRAAAELEADARATGPDPGKRVALASALIKVARLSSAHHREFAVLVMPVALDDVEGRVRRLLAPLSTPPAAPSLRVVAACALSFAILTMPLHGLVQEWVEVLVAFGR
jgi:Zn-dependent protease with chaperone function